MAAMEVVMLGTASFLSKTISYQSMVLESTLWRSIRGGLKQTMQSRFFLHQGSRYVRTRSASEVI